MADATGFEPEEWALWRDFRAVQARLTLAIDQQLQRDAGIDQAEYGILASLFEAEDRHLRVRDLCVELGWERSRMSHRVAQMERRGLVSRESVPHDGRAAWVELTPAGARMLLGAVRGHAQLVRRAFLDLLAPGEPEAMQAVLTRVLARLDHDRL